IGGVVAIALAVGPLRGAAPPPSASPLPVQTPGPASAVGESAHLQGVADLALSGGSSRFDYQSLDPRTSLLFIAHLGAGIVTALTTASNTVVADIPNVADVHGVLAIPELGRVYASATG